jgi:hypothetical protein
MPTLLHNHIIQKKNYNQRIKPQKNEGSVIIVAIGCHYVEKDQRKE